MNQDMMDDLSPISDEDEAVNAQDKQLSPIKAQQSSNVDPAKRGRGRPKKQTQELRSPSRQQPPTASTPIAANTSVRSRTSTHSLIHSLTGKAKRVAPAPPSQGKPSEGAKVQTLRGNRHTRASQRAATDKGKN